MNTRPTGIGRCASPEHGNPAHVGTNRSTFRCARKLDTSANAPDKQRGGCQTLRHVKLSRSDRTLPRPSPKAENLETKPRCRGLVLGRVEDRPTGPRQVVSMGGPAA